MAEFDESDLRPFSGLQRPITALPEDDIQFEHPGSSRPMTSANRPMTSGRQGPPGSRPMTSMIGRPTTGSVPDWMMEDESQGPDRPKTGYRKQDGSIEVRPRNPDIQSSRRNNFPFCKITETIFYHKSLKVFDLVYPFHHSIYNETKILTLI